MDRRVRRAFEEGVEALGDAELVALVLGVDHRTAGEIVDRFAGVERIARLGPAGLADIGPAKAARIAAGIELGRRAARHAGRSRAPLRSAEEVVQHIGPVLRGLDHEETWVLALDGQKNLRGARRVAQGGLHGCSVMARDILRAALADAASTMIVAHNHPSGDPIPSEEDLAMTRTLTDAGHAAGVPLVDHVIVTPDGKFRSLLGMGIIAPV